MKKPLLLAPVVAAFSLAACTGSAGPQAITVSARAMQYQPAKIEITAGQPVRLTFRNNDALEHDLSVMEFPMSQIGATPEPVVGHDMDPTTVEPELHVAAAMGETGMLEFTPSKPGTYEFFCTVVGHRQAGMVGTLTVRAP
jgi:uncharacterized cupredoxin-like copper-binding protein